MISFQPNGRIQPAESGEPLFEPGQLVTHRRYGYRGVVVSVDIHCQANDNWYYSNQTQPKRDQPWYHVLVHNSTSCTYAAQSSLVADSSGEPIDHPLVEQFFSSFEKGYYLRNSRPWSM